jgi:hypothetical protein
MATNSNDHSTPSIYLGTATQTSSLPPLYTTNIYTPQLSLSFLLRLVVALLGPSGLAEPGYLIELELIPLLLLLVPLETRVHLLVDDLEDLRNDGVPLLPQYLRDIHIVDVLHDLTLHHSRAIVILNVTLPSRLRHITFLVETLFLEKLSCIVVCIGKEILKTLLLCMILQLIH